MNRRAGVIEDCLTRDGSDDALSPFCGWKLRYVARVSVRDRPAENAMLRMRRALVAGSLAALVLSCLAGGLAARAAVRPSASPGLGGPGDWPKELSFSPSGKILATADTDGTARMWSVRTGRQIGSPIRLASGVSVLDVAFSPRGKVLATAESDGTVRLWKLPGRRQLGKPIRVSSVRVLRVAFSPDGKLVATAGIGGQARLWDVATRRQIGAAMMAGGGLFTVAFSPSGKILATTDRQDRARLWNVASQHQIGRAIGGQPPMGAAVLGLAFSPDGTILATAGNENGQVRLWRVATHRQIGHYLSAGFTDTYGVAFTPDGKVLITTDTDGTIREWNIRTRQQIGKTIAPKHHPEFLLGILSPDGTTLATTQFLGPAQLWVLKKP
jgi:WD40 repeat protein